MWNGGAGAAKVGCGDKESGGGRGGLPLGSESSGEGVKLIVVSYLRQAKPIQSSPRRLHPGAPLSEQPRSDRPVYAQPDQHQRQQRRRRGKAQQRRAAVDEAVGKLLQ